MSVSRDKHVRRELRRMGKSEEVVEAYRTVGEAFDVLVTAVTDEAIQNGNLEPDTINTVIRQLLDLLAFKNLTPLTDDPDEWVIISEVLAQSKRNPNAFSTTQGKTYYLLDEKDRQTKTFPVHISEHVEPPPPPPPDPDPVDPPPVEEPPPPPVEEPPPPVEEPPPPPVEVELGGDTPLAKLFRYSGVERPQTRAQSVEDVP